VDSRVQDAAATGQHDGVVGPEELWCTPPFFGQAERWPCAAGVGGIPPFPKTPKAAPQLAGEIGTLLLPALIAPELKAIAADLAANSGDPTKAAVVETQLACLTGRIVFAGGWTASGRHSGAEPLCTGRARPYDESTLRKQAGAWAKAGGAQILARYLEAQVETAVENGGQKVVAYSDIHDQPFFTKRPAHAGPIGRLGNRILAATYLGLTFIKLSHDGPSLGYSISWLKPASPLIDALEQLYGDERRRNWLLNWIRIHNWDRGGNGEAVLVWAAGVGIPYLTLCGKTFHYTKFLNPTLLTSNKLPVFVRPHPGPAAAAKAAGNGLEPRTVIFPAHPEQGRNCTKALGYQTAAVLTRKDHATINLGYKTRWPSMENKIKVGLAVGFGVNRDRTLQLTTGRGVDGKIKKLTARETQLKAEIEQLQPAITASQLSKVKTRKKKLRKVRAQRRALEHQPLTKGARAPTGSELLCKNLLMLLLNALALLLATSPMDEVRTMTPAMLRELLLAQPALASLEAGTITLWVAPMVDARQQRLQVELLRIFDGAALNSRHGRLHFRMRKAIYRPPLRGL